MTGDLYELVVRGVFGEDEDTYTARAINAGGSKSSQADLRIKTAPRSADDYISLYISQYYSDCLHTFMNM